MFSVKQTHQKDVRSIMFFCIDSYSAQTKAFLWIQCYQNVLGGSSGPLQCHNC